MIPVATTIAEVRAAVARARMDRHTIGLVPTMGALHSGHGELIRACKENANFVVVSVFVNPTQFGPNEDFARYPRTLDADRTLCKEAGGDLAFIPSVEEMYPSPHRTSVTMERLGNGLCGASRPGHFSGVCTVVLKLFNIVSPDVSLFGAKDYQQAAIVRQMVLDLNVPVEVRVIPTVRESDGLAMSSRNRYLSADNRNYAPAIYRALVSIRDRANAGERSVVLLEEGLGLELAAIPGARVDYARIVDASTLESMLQLDKPAVAAVAVELGYTRLIDNINLP